MKQKVGITIVCAVIALVSVSCSALWTVENKADISFSLSKEALTAMSQASNVRSIDSDNDIVTATISLLGENGNAVDSKPVFLEDDKEVSVLFENLPIIGDNIYAKIEATIDGLKYEGISETKKMTSGENSLHISEFIQVSKTFTITFDANNGTGEKLEQIFNEGISQKLAENGFTAPSGTMFAGWTAISGGKVQYVDEEEYTATKDVTLIAVWAKPYTLTFNANGGTVDPESKMVLDGMPIGDLPIPGKTDSTFSAWQIDGASISSDTVYTYSANKEAIAIWDAETYTVTFDTNGGTELDAITAIENTKIAKPADPEKANASFVGWYKDTALTTPWNFESDVVTSDMTLYADWNDTIYTITFDANGGSGTMQAQTFIHGVPQELSFNLFTPPSGMVFMGWATEADAENATFEDLEIYTATENKTFYAVWKTVYRITFTDGNTTYIQNLPEGVEIPLLKFSFPIPAGNAFLGWTTTNGGIAVEYTDEQEYTATKDVTMYAVWLINPTKVTATLSENDTVLTVTPTTDNTGTSLKAAMHAAVDDSIRPNITKIVISAPTDGSQIIPETDLSYLFSDGDGNSSYNYFTSLTTIEGLEHIDTSSVTNMSSMFYSCYALTSLTLPQSFDTSRVTNMIYMFGRCHSLISLELPESFDTSSVTNMSSMFRECSSLTSLTLPQSFNTSRVTAMTFMFYTCTALNTLQLPENFDTSSVIDMQYMFADCSALTSLTLPECFDTSNVTIMRHMFYNCSALTGLTLPESFNTSKVTNRADMFSNVTLETVTVGSAITQAVSDQIKAKTGTFNGINYNGTWVPQTTPSATGTDTLPVADGKAAAGTYTAKGTPTTKVTATISGTTLTVTPTTDDTGTSLKAAMHAAVDDSNRGSITKIVINKPSSGLIIPETDLSRLFSDDDGYDGYSLLTTIEGLEHIDTSSVTNMSYMFHYCRALTNFDLSSFDTSSVTTMQSMFYNCIALTSLELPESFDTSSVTDMRSMFYGCNKLTRLVLTESFNTSNVTNMSAMFNGCSSLASLTLPDSFNTSKVTTMQYMFNDCSSLASLTLPESFDTSSVTSMNYMFYNCSSLTTLNLSSFDTSKVTYTTDMFTDVTLETVTVGSALTQAVSTLIEPKTGTFNGVIYANPGMWTWATPPAGESETLPVVGGKAVAGTYTAKGTPMTKVTAKITNNVLTVTPTTDDTGTSLKAAIHAEVTDSNRGSITEINIVAPASGLIVPETDLSRLFSDDVGDIGYAMLETIEGLAHIDTSGVTDMSYMFYNCASLINLDLLSFNTSSVTNMSEMFRSCGALTSLTLSSFDTSNVTNMNAMFRACGDLTSLVLTESFNTAKVIDMGSMFYYCDNLTSLELPQSFDTSLVTNMGFMFRDCTGLTSLTLPENFNTSNVESVYLMFSNVTLDTVTVGSQLTQAVSTLIKPKTGTFNGVIYVDPGMWTWTSSPAGENETLPVVDGNAVAGTYTAKRL